MRTSEQVYNRFLWDPSLAAQASSIALHHTDRVKNTLTETRLLDWRPLSAGGDIPWHRVQKISHDALGVLWDRPSGIDRVFPDGGITTLLKDLPPPPATHFYARSLAAAGCSSPKSPLQFQDLAWRPVAPKDVQRFETLRVAFWNVCIDTFNKHVDHAARFQTLINHLSDMSSTLDVIALAEVQPHFCNALLSEKWVRDNFTVPFDPLQTAELLSPYGVFVLVRRNLVSSWTTYTYSFSTSKHAMFVILNSPTEPLVVIPILHLTSNHSDGEVKRRVQLKAVKDILQKLDYSQRIIVLADFNARDDSPAQLSLRDAWTELRIEDGATFHPIENSFARLSALSETPARFDRILYGGTGLSPMGTSLFGNKAVEVDDGESVWMSDHFGIRATFEMESCINPASHVADATGLSHKKAVVVIPPIEVWEAIQAVRRSHDSSYKRWMPHMNLLYGFVDFTDEEELDDIVEIIRDGASNHSAFEVVLDEVDRFEHAASTTFYAKPDDESVSRLRKLQSSLQALFPNCTEQSRHGLFNPHLKIANERAVDGRCDMPGFLEKFAAVRFCVQNVYVISREDEGSFKVLRRIPLSKYEQAGIQKLIPQVEAILQQSVQECRTPSGTPSFSMQVVGSRGMGLCDESSDLDIVCETTGSHTQLAESVMHMLRFSGVADSTHLASKWKNECVVRAVLAEHGFGVDILISCGGKAGRQAISATNFIRGCLSDMSDRDVTRFKSLYVDCIKPWTKYRYVTGCGTRMLPTVAYVVLALSFWKMADRTQFAHEVETAFFKTFSQLGDGAIDCRSPGDASEDENCVATIWKPVAQRENLAKSLSDGNVVKLREEFKRAARSTCQETRMRRRELWRDRAGVIVIGVGFERLCDVSKVQGCLIGRMGLIADTLDGCVETGGGKECVGWPGVFSGRMKDVRGALRNADGIEGRRLMVGVCYGICGEIMERLVEGDGIGVMRERVLWDIEECGVLAGEFVASVEREVEEVWEMYVRDGEL